MAESPSPRRGGAGALAAFVLVLVVMAALAPNLVGAWIGRLIGDVWATALAAITALVGGLFSGG